MRPHLAKVTILRVNDLSSAEEDDASNNTGGDVHISNDPIIELLGMV